MIVIKTMKGQAPKTTFTGWLWILNHQKKPITKEAPKTKPLKWNDAGKKRESAEDFKKRLDHYDKTAHTRGRVVTASDEEGLILTPFSAN